MAPKRAKRRATYSDLERVPPHQVAEIIDGELVVSPRPGARHTSAATVLGGLLVGPFGLGSGGPGGWVILDEPELHLGRQVVVPDLAGWRRERMPEIPDVAAFKLAPDWVCEVLSPSTEGVDRARKMRIYSRARVEHAWLVNPLVRTLEVYRREKAWVLVDTFEGDVRVRAEPFAAVELNLAYLWKR